ncbi:MAG: YnbE family lipoprotein [Pseudomonadota bacterium]|nr:MAG: YnbE family lipoprotein [Pseudomonadota bacterium]
MIKPFHPTFVLTATLGAWVTACTPTVQVAVPDKPITINLNVKIEHEIRVKVEKELEDVFSKDSGLF